MSTLAPHLIQFRGRSHTDVGRVGLLQVFVASFEDLIKYNYFVYVSMLLTQALKSVNE